MGEFMNDHATERTDCFASSRCRAGEKVSKRRITHKYARTIMSYALVRILPVLQPCPQVVAGHEAKPHVCGITRNATAVARGYASNLAISARAIVDTPPHALVSHAKQFVGVNYL
jgi:hypothetical protein